MLMTGSKDRRRIRQGLEKRAGPQQPVVAPDDGLLMESRATGLGVNGSCHEVPHVRLERRLGLQTVKLITVANLKFDAAGYIDAQPITLFPLVVPSPDRTLALPAARQ